ncbi:MAG: hypothetical protein L3J04_07495 [Robiginitomaculum sp.]|nr:hypothetical protein [Robiginitomaculum sp.]
MSDPGFVAALDNMFSYVSEGEEIRRDIVGSSFKVNSSLGKGTTKTYSLVFEVQTDKGFTSIGLVYFQSVQDNECCILQHINVQGFDSSPHRVPMESIGKVLMIIGTIVLLGITLLIFFLVRRRKKRRQIG